MALAPRPPSLRPMDQPRNRPSPLISHVLPISHVPQCERERPRRVGPDPDQPARGGEGRADPATPLTYHHEGSTCGEDRWRRSMGSEGSGRSRSLRRRPVLRAAHLRCLGDQTAAPASNQVGRHNPTPRGAAGLVGTFRVRSEGGSSHDVEIHSLTDRLYLCSRVLIPVPRRDRRRARPASRRRDHRRAAQPAGRTTQRQPTSSST